MNQKVNLINFVLKVNLYLALVQVQLRKFTQVETENGESFVILISLFQMKFNFKAVFYIQTLFPSKELY